MAIMTIPHPETMRNKGRDYVFETQPMYVKSAETYEKDGVTTIDVSNVKIDTKQENLFFVKSKEPIETWIGCDVFDYDKEDGVWTYIIRPISNVMKFDNV